MVDNLQRLYVWHDSGHPLLVVVGKSWDNIFSLWRREALRIGGIMLALIVLVMGATMFLAREIKRRASAEDRLEELATTDPLTQLRNRRKFDAVLEREWRRALRHDEPLALLMIDADHFKTFNDMFGHQAGDQVLVRIAGSITEAVDARRRLCRALWRRGVRRAAARPLRGRRACGRGGVRAKVEMLSVEKWATTISVGVASMIPTAATTPALLIEAADKALYEAKSRGRNQSFVAKAPQLSLVA